MPKAYGLFVFAVSRRAVMKPIGGFTASKGLDATEKKKAASLIPKKSIQKSRKTMQNTEVVFCVDVKEWCFLGDFNFA